MKRSVSIVVSVFLLCLGTTAGAKTDGTSSRLTKSRNMSNFKPAWMTGSSRLAIFPKAAEADSEEADPSPDAEATARPAAANRAPGSADEAK